ncbi:MAG: hypothetical protein DRN88_02455 [Candidatus Hydrothermarchaeota archaeon]|nr:MAG: hypothetical protein DRN88_02455 [Candidatus Hydrothermarchaeota archaeon]
MSADIKKLGYMWVYISIISIGIAGILVKRSIPTVLKFLLTIGVSLAMLFVIANIIAMFYGISKMRS